MAKSGLDKVVRHICRVAAEEHWRRQRDGELLRAFVRRGDQHAFAVLVKRYGPLVLATCRRVLRQLEDAEDAFQATFIVLARQARALAKNECVGGWLHRVAHRLALNARRALQRRRHHERQATAMNPTNPECDAAWREVQIVLDDEIQRLSAKYRDPFILCVLDGQSCAAAAQRLGLNEGTVRSRLAEARKRLQARLSRRGVDLTAVLGAAALAPGVATARMATAQVASALVAKTVAAASGAAAPASVMALVKGWTASLAIKKAKVGMALLLFLGATVGTTRMGAVQQEAGEKEKGPRAQAVGKLETAVKAEAIGKPAADPERVGDGPAGEALPPGALFRIGSTRLQHGSPIYAVAVTPDGKLVASVSWDGDLSVWEMPTGRERFRKPLGPRSHGFFLAFTPDAKSLLVKKENKHWLLDVETGQFGKQIDSAATGGFSPDGKVLIVTDGATIRRLDWATGKTLSTWQFRKEVPEGFGGGLRGGMSSVDSRLSPDGTLLAMIETYHFNNNEKQTLRVHEVASGKELYRLKLSAPYVRDVAFVGDNKFVVTASSNSMLRVWELATGNAVREWKPDPREDVNYSRGLHVTTMPDGQSILAQGPNGLIRWDWRNGNKLHSYSDTTGPIALMDGGKAMAVQGWQSVNSLWVLDTATGKNVCPLSRPGDRVAFSPDGRLIAWSESEALVLANAATGKQIRRWPAHEEGVAPLTFAPDGKTLASAGRDNRIRLWDVSTGTEIRSMEQLGVSRLAYSADGKRLAAVYGWHKDLWIWDAATGQQLGKWQANVLAALDPGVRLAAVGDRKDKVLRLVDLANGKGLHVLPGYQERIGHQYQAKDGKRGSQGDFPPLFSPDGQLLLAGAEARAEVPDDFDSLERGGAGVVQFWDAAGGKRLPPKISGRQFIVDRNLAFSPDSRLLAIMRSDCTICLMDTATGEVVRTLGKADGPMTAPAVFTPDGRLLVTAVHDRVQVWEVASGGELASRLGHRGRVDVLVVSPGGRSVATVSLDHTILVWDLTRLSTGALAKPPLTPAQLESAWQDLTSSNAALGRRAVESLCADPAQAVALVRERLLPVKSTDNKEVARWIADLSSDVFAQRQLAEANLERLGELAGPALRAAFAATPPLEAQRRMSALLTKLRPAVLPPEALRGIRGVQVLEMIANPEARKVLAVLAGGAAGARLTQEAQASLERLAR